MAVNEWLNNIMQADQQARGLSGGKGAGLVLDESNPYYNYRLKRFSAGGDLVRDPTLLWGNGSGGGLGPHIESARGDGIAGFTDALLILSHEDFAQTTRNRDWTQEATRILLQQFEDFCRREAFSRRYAHRQLGFRILCDGSAEMGGQSLGLKAGEFVTGLVPNLYTGPVRGSYPVVGVHVNLPGVWDGYQEVGRLYNDQIVFTIGSHWLDNFHHPSLRDGAIYRLQQDADGNFMHVVNPDLSDTYQVTSTEQEGANVLTLATRDGVPLAYMVLAVMDPPAAEPEPEPAPAPGIQMPEIKMPMAPQSPDSRYTIPPPMMMDDDPAVGFDDEEPETIRMEKPAPSKPKSKTIIPDAVKDRILTLTERGALLQKVHFGAFMQGYDVYVSDQGELGTAIEDPAATFQVRRKEVSIVSHIPGVAVGGRKVAPGIETLLEADTTIEIGGETLEYRHLRGIEVAGWPYVGEIRRAASSTYLAWGDQYKIGRSRDCRVALPDEPSNDNIQWKPEVQEGTTIRSRSGPIPKSQFYTDSIMVSSQHAQISLDHDSPELEVLARNCYAYIRRNGEIHAIYPSASTKGDSRAAVQPGDELLIGNCLFKVGFAPAGQEAAQPSMDMAPPMLPEDAPPPPPMLWEDAMAEQAEEAPAAHGLGQDGPMPVPVEFDGGPDSILGEPPPEEMTPDAAPPMPPPSALDSFEADSGEWDADPDSVSIPGALADFDLEAPPEIESRDDEPSVDQFSEPGDTQLPGGEIQQSKTVPPPFPDVESTLDEDEGGDWPFEEGPTQAVGDEDVAQVLRALAPPIDEDELDGEFEMATEALPSLASFDDIDDATADEPFLEEPPEDVTDEPEVTDLDEPFPHAVDEEDEVEDDAPFGAALTDAPPADPLHEPPAPPEPSAEEPPPFPEPPAPPEPSAEEPPPFPEPIEEPPPAPEPIAEAPPAPEPIVEAPPAPEPIVEAPPAPEPIVEAPPAPEPIAQTEQAPAADTAAEVRVVEVDDETAQFELGRRVQLVQVGWMVKGTMVAGNHTGADLIIPESRLTEEQQFSPKNYFELTVRGRRQSLTVLDPREILIDEDDAKKETYDNVAELLIDVIRRDEYGEEDFGVRLGMLEDRSLPDPRARLLGIDSVDPLTAALMCRGLPTRADRRLSLQGIDFTLFYDGEGVKLSDYLDTYKQADGTFLPFFVQFGDSRFTTVPEDGAAVQLSIGDRLVVGNAVYQLIEA